MWKPAETNVDSSREFQVRFFCSRISTKEPTMWIFKNSFPYYLFISMKKIKHYKITLNSCYFVAKRPRTFKFNFHESSDKITVAPKAAKKVSERKWKVWIVQQCILYMNEVTPCCNHLHAMMMHHHRMKPNQRSITVNNKEDNDRLKLFKYLNLPNERVKFLLIFRSGFRTINSLCSNSL